MCEAHSSTAFSKCHLWVFDLVWAKAEAPFPRCTSSLPFISICLYFFNNSTPTSPLDQPFNRPHTLLWTQHPHLIISTIPSRSSPSSEGKPIYLLVDQELKDMQILPTFFRILFFSFLYMLVWAFITNKKYHDRHCLGHYFKTTYINSMKLYLPDIKRVTFKQVK